MSERQEEARLLTIAFVCGRFQAVSVVCCVTISCDRRTARSSIHRQLCERVSSMGGTSALLFPPRPRQLLLRTPQDRIPMQH